MLHTCDAGVTPLDDVIRLRQNRIGPMPYYLGAVLLSLRRRCPFRGHLELKIERYNKGGYARCIFIKLSMLVVVQSQLPPQHAVKQQHGTTLQSTSPTFLIATLSAAYQRLNLWLLQRDLPPEDNSREAALAR